MNVKTKRQMIKAILFLAAILAITGIIAAMLFFMSDAGMPKAAAKQAPEGRIATEPKTPPVALPPSAIRDVALRAEDGVTLSSTYYPAPGDGVILLHQLGGSKEDWASLAGRLQDEGYAVIAVDMRGHGDSALDWEDFAYPSGKTKEAQNDFLGMVLDATAAKKYLNQQGKHATVVMGASIGANIAVLYAETDSRIKDLVLFSPGLNYRGVQLPSGPLYDGKVLLIASLDDDPATEALEKYSGRIRGQHKTIEYPGNAHGTGLLDQADLDDRIIEWLRR